MPFRPIDADYLLRVLPLSSNLRASLERFRAGAGALSIDELTDLRELVGQRLQTHGFGPDYEPTPEGRRLEQLIDDLDVD